MLTPRVAGSNPVVSANLWEGQNPVGNIETFISFVKEQIELQERFSTKYAYHPYRQNLHVRTRQKFVELKEYLEGSKDQSLLGDVQKRRSPSRKVVLSLKDLDGLPEELLKELNIAESDRQELLIEDIITAAGGVLSLDKIIIELYRRTREITKRNTLISRLYRMSNKGIIYSLPGKKGLYSTYELSEQDVRRLFGEFDSEEPDKLVDKA
jgi:hypothetical protein